MWRSWGWVRLVFFCGLLVSPMGCGPAHLSALGNPGDLCTEETACTEGTRCLLTDDGYRCVERGASSRSSSGSSEARDRRDHGFSAVESSETSGDGEGSEESEAESSDDSDTQPYVPPSRRRRRGGRR